MSHSSWLHTWRWEEMCIYSWGLQALGSGRQDHVKVETLELGCLSPNSGSTTSWLGVLGQVLHGSVPQFPYL